VTAFDDTSPLLKVREVSKRFGGVHALRSVSIDVRPGQILGLLGANGSGKTTMLNVISGRYRPTSGTIEYKGESIGGKAPDAIAGLGIARTFQQAMTFPGVSVRENLRIVSRDRRRVQKTCERFGLTEHADLPAGSLSHGMQRLLGVGMALLTDPGLLLLDEPAAGLARADADNLATLLASLRSEGLTMVVVDHDMSFVLPLCDQVVVLNAGEFLFTGSAEAMREDKSVQQAYLGTVA
jgi:ABC-type branched-subunit amino acid transport system ATPase component